MTRKRKPKKLRKANDQPNQKQRKKLILAVYITLEDLVSWTLFQMQSTPKSSLAPITATLSKKMKTSFTAGAWGTTTC